MDPDAAWLAWNQATNKATFIAHLDLVTAQILVERILREEPGGRRLTRARAKTIP